MMNTTCKKTVVLRMKDEAGRVYRWSSWKDGQFWFLMDDTGYVRTLEGTWNDSVPRIRAIAENHGLVVNIS